MLEAATSLVPPDSLMYVLMLQEKRDKSMFSFGVYFPPLCVFSLNIACVLIAYFTFMVAVLKFNPIVCIYYMVKDNLLTW